MVVVTYSLQNIKINEHKVIAVQYAQQLNAWIKAQKETDWNSFIPYSGYSYCFNTAPITSWPAQQIVSPPCASTDFSLGGLYKRETTLTSLGTPPDKIQIDITVSWYEAGRSFTSPLHTNLSRWE